MYRDYIMLISHRLVILLFVAGCTCSTSSTNANANNGIRPGSGIASSSDDSLLVRVPNPSSSFSQEENEFNEIAVALNRSVTDNKMSEEEQVSLALVNSIFDQ